MVLNETLETSASGRGLNLGTPSARGHPLITTSSKEIDGLECGKVHREDDDERAELEYSTRTERE
ncbi:MAG: hypothetical protein Kow0069_33950 [Promethearchaeota archaeon]